MDGHTDPEKSFTGREKEEAKTIRAPGKKDIEPGIQPA